MIDCTHPSTGYEGSCCSMFSPILGINSLFNFSPSGRCLSLIPNEMEYFFINVLTAWISSFAKSLLSPHLFKKKIITIELSVLLIYRSYIFYEYETCFSIGVSVLFLLFLGVFICAR